MADTYSKFTQACYIAHQYGYHVLSCSQGFCLMRGKDTIEQFEVADELLAYLEDLIQE